MYSIIKYSALAAIAGISAEFVWYAYKRYKQNISNNSIDVLFVNISRGCCFGLETECNGEHCVGRVTRRIVDCIDAAKSTVRLAMYRISHKPFVDAVIRAKVRGVKVQVLVDQRLLLENGVNDFERKGVTVRCFDRLDNIHKLNTDFIFHHKFCIIDAADKNLNNGSAANSNIVVEDGVFIGGSLNWTRNAMTKNCENIVVTRNEDIVQAYKKEFDTLWRDTQRTAYAVGY